MRSAWWNRRGGLGGDCTWRDHMPDLAAACAGQCDAAWERRCKRTAAQQQEAGLLTSFLTGCSSTKQSSLVRCCRLVQNTLRSRPPLYTVVNESLAARHHTLSVCSCSVCRAGTRGTCRAQFSSGWERQERRKWCRASSCD